VANKPPDTEWAITLAEPGSISHAGVHGQLPLSPAGRSSTCCRSKAECASMAATLNQLYSFAGLVFSKAPSSQLEARARPWLTPTTPHIWLCTIKKNSQLNNLHFFQSSVVKISSTAEILFHNFNLVYFSSLQAKK
jgi:hypothetical protein